MENKLHMFRENLSSFRAELYNLSSVPAHLRTDKQNQVIEKLSALINELNLYVRMLERDEKNKRREKPNFKIVEKPRLIRKFCPSGNSYLEPAKDRQGNPIMQEHLEADKLIFREEQGELGEKIWHVSKECRKV